MTKNQGNYSDAREERKRSKAKSGEPRTPDKPFRWCNASLSESAKADILEKEFDAERMFEFVEGLVADGYKVTQGRDDRSDCFIVVVVGRVEGRADYNVGVSSRHHELTVALLTTQYKFEVMFMGGIIPTEGLESKASVWD